MFALFTILIVAYCITLLFDRQDARNRKQVNKHPDDASKHMHQKP